MARLTLEELGGKTAQNAEDSAPAYLSMAVPGARFLLIRKGSTWNEGNAEQYDTFCPHEPHVKLSGISNDEWQKVNSSPVALPGFELYPGVTCVVGGLGSGKTAFLERTHAHVDSTNQGEIGVISFLEPLEPARMLGSLTDTISQNSRDLLRHLSGMFVNAERPKLLIIDSLSAFAFQSWQGWATQSAGVNSGFVFWLTSLSNLAHLLGTIVLVTFNPGPEITSRGQDLVDMLSRNLGGRTHGFIVTQTTGGTLQAQYSGRRPDGERQLQDVSNFLTRGFSNASGSSTNKTLSPSRNYSIQLDGYKPII